MSRVDDIVDSTRGIRRRVRDNGEGRCAEARRAISALSAQFLHSRRPCTNPIVLGRCPRTDRALVASIFGAWLGLDSFWRDFGLRQGLMTPSPRAAQDRPPLTECGSPGPIPCCAPSTYRIWANVHQHCLPARISASCVLAIVRCSLWNVSRHRYVSVFHSSHRRTPVSCSGSCLVLSRSALFC